MVRRKKSLLFSVSLASAGLVAGALFVAAPKSQATGEELNATTTDAKIQQISEETDIPSSIVEDSLKTHKLILGVTDEKVLDENDDIADHKKVAEGVYIVTFKNYDATSENYYYYKNSDKADNVELNIPLKLIDNTDLIPSGPGDPDYDRCAETTSETATFTNFTRLPDQCLGWGVDSMKILDYAKTIQDAEEVTVAVLDSGIRATHRAFSYSENNAQDRLKMSLAYDYIDDDTNPDDSNNDNYQDDEGNDTGVRVQHGTSVAGTITESTPYNVKVVPVRVTSGQSLHLDTVIEAVSDLKGKVDVINLSLGSARQISKPYSTEVAAIDKVFKETKEAGTIVVAATGNGHPDAGYVSYPAASDYTIAVGSVDSNNTIAASSQRGNEVDFTAPGVRVLLPDGNTDSAISNTSGTSFATPFISAAVANILSEHPNYSFNDVYNELKLNTEDVGSAGKDSTYGWGSVSFHINKFADLKVTRPTTSEEWTNQDVTLNLAASSNDYNVTNYAFNSGNTTKTAPSSWTAVATPGKSVTATKSVSSNGTYTIWFKNANNEISAKTVTVNNIDKAAPTITTGLAVKNISGTSATFSISAKDTTSGLDSVVWHIKTESDEEYKDAPNNHTGETGVVTDTISTDKLEAGTKYMVYATIFDRAGNAKDSSIVTFLAADDGDDITTGGDEDEPTNTNTNTGTNTTSTTKPKTPKTSNNVKNPQTADINLPAIAGIGTVLSAAAFFIFRAKRR